MNEHLLILGFFLVLQSEDDAQFEQDIMRDPYGMRPWLQYIEFKIKNGTIQEQVFVSIHSAITWDFVFSFAFMFAFQLPPQPNMPYH